MPFRIPELPLGSLQRGSIKARVLVGGSVVIFPRPLSPGAIARVVGACRVWSPPPLSGVECTQSQKRRVKTRDPSGWQDRWRAWATPLLPPMAGRRRRTCEL